MTAASSGGQRTPVLLCSGQHLQPMVSPLDGHRHIQHLVIVRRTLAVFTCSVSVSHLLLPWSSSLP